MCAVLRARAEGGLRSRAGCVAYAADSNRAATASQSTTFHHASR
jgi:hypothetical protein